MSIEQEFADKLVQYKHIIYKVCFMYADNKDDVNDLFQESVFNIWTVSYTHLDVYKRQDYYNGHQ